jgi:hypothetical protein
VNRGDIESAIELARQAVGAGRNVPASAVTVRRLDRPDAEYVLVQLGEPRTAGWIAAVDVKSRDVMSWAANPSGAPTTPTPPTGHREAEFVWRPSAVSRSPLYPLLRITTEDGQRFVDLAGRTYIELVDGRG